MKVLEVLPIESPIRQGDVVSFDGAFSGPYGAKAAVVLTADCDLAQSKHYGHLLLCPMVPITSFVKGPWAHRRIRKLRANTTDKIRASLESLLNTEGGPLAMDRNPFKSTHAYAYAFPAGWSDLSSGQPDQLVFDRGVKEFSAFVELQWDAIDAAAHPGVGIQLSDESFFHQENSAGFIEWYRLRLTARQREFVDAPLTLPIRLRGCIPIRP